MSKNLFYNKEYQFFLIFLISQLMGLRFFLNSSYISFNPYIAFATYVLLSFILFYFFIKSRIINFFLGKYLFFLVIITSLILLYHQYPIQDNLKILNLGSDQDDCFIIIINNIINNNKIYSETYLGNPCSTGMAEFIFYFPVILFKNYFFIIPIISLLMIFFVFKNEFDYKTSLLIFYIQICNLVFVELSSAGSDFMLIGASYLLGIYLLKEALDKNNNFFFTISFILLFFFYGSRSILFLLLPLNFLFFYLYVSKNIMKYFICLFIVSILSYLIPWAITYPDYFPPFHLFSKGLYFLLSVKFSLILLIIIFLIILILFQRKINLRFLNKNYYYYLNYIVLIIPLSFISLSRIFVVDQLANWESLNYFMIFLPSLYYLILSISNNFNYNENKK